jgi:hypothetical protein
MDDSPLMCRGQPRTQLARDVEGLVFREAPDSPERCREIFSVDVLHREIEQTAGLTDVIDPTHIGMRDLSSGAHFVVELREPRRIAAKLHGQELQRDRLSETEIVRPVHFAHPAASEQADDSVPFVENGARSESSVVDGIRGGQPAAR